MQKPNVIPLILLLGLGLLAALMPAVPTTIVMKGLDSGDTA